MVIIEMFYKLNLNLLHSFDKLSVLSHCVSQVLCVYLVMSKSEMILSCDGMWCTEVLKVYFQVQVMWVQSSHFILFYSSSLKVIFKNLKYFCFQTIHLMKPSNKIEIFYNSAIYLNNYKGLTIVNKNIHF